MPLVGLKNNDSIGTTAKAYSIETWCEEHIGPYNESWYWVAAYGENLVLRILNDDDAMLFRLTFCS